MSDAGLESLYREVILDHYKNPRGHGVIEDADAEAEGQNPLCGDEVSIYVEFGEDGETIDDVKFSGRGCAISQAATSMLMEMTKGRTAEQVAALDKDELLAEIGVPLSPIRLKCAMLGLTTLKVALHKAKGTPLPAGPAGFDEDRPPRDPVRRRLQLRRRAVRDRGPLLARRRATLRGRLGRGAVPRHLPAARVGVRPRDGDAAQPARDGAGRDVLRARRRRLDRG